MGYKYFQRARQERDYSKGEVEQVFPWPRRGTFSPVGVVE